MKIRSTNQEDIAGVQRVLDGTGLFPTDMLPGMVGDFLSGGDGPDIWLTCELTGRAVGFCYAAPETLAEGAWNMRAIAVLPEVQGRGCGVAITQHLEAKLRSLKQRILIADTSGMEAFSGTRAFYRKAGYTEEACIRDFWGAGDDKIVFWKSLV